MTDDEMLAIHMNAVQKGFWNDTVDHNFILAKLCLVHSEISEVMEAYRKRQGSEKILEEFADVFIRCYDLLVGMVEYGYIDDYNIDDVIRAKMAINAERPALHGNLI